MVAMAAKNPRKRTRRPSKKPEGAEGDGGEITWRMVCAERVRFQRECNQDKLMASLPQKVLDIVFALYKDPAKILPAHDVVHAETLLTGTKRKKAKIDESDVEECVDWKSVEKISQVPKYVLWEFLRRLDPDFWTKEIMRFWNGKDNCFPRKVFEAMTGLRGVYRVPPSMRNAHVFGRVAKYLLSLFGNRWPLVKKVLEAGGIAANTCGVVYEFAERNSEGFIEKIVHISGAETPVPRSVRVTPEHWHFVQNFSDRFAKCTDGVNEFSCYPRLIDAEDEFWHKFASNPMAELESILTTAVADIGKEERQLASSDLNISSAVVHVAQVARRRNTKGPPPVMTYKYEEGPKSMPEGEVPLDRAG